MLDGVKNLPDDPLALKALIASMVVELDFRAMNVHLAYSLAGHQFRDIHGETDPYDLPGHMNLNRTYRKQATLLALACRSRSSAERAYRKWLRDEGLNLPADCIPLLFEAVQHRHQPIDNWLFHDQAPTLAYVESRVSTHVINQATEIGIPILNIHDGFVTSTQHKEEIKRMIEEEF